MSAVVDRVRSVVAPLVADAGLDLEDVEVQPAGRRRLVRVLVDRDGGVTLDDVAAVSSRLSEALDAQNAMGDQAYVLEVTSPGTDRPLTAPRHWRRNVGRLVEGSTVDGSGFRGRVSAAGDDAAELVTDDGPVSVAYASVAAAHVVVEFRRDGEE